MAAVRPHRHRDILAESAPLQLGTAGPRNPSNRAPRPTDTSREPVRRSWRLGERSRERAVSRPRRALGRRDLHARRGRDASRTPTRPPTDAGWASPDSARRPQRGGARPPRRPEPGRRVAAPRARRPSPGQQDPFFARVRHADGHWLPVELVGNNLSDDERRPRHVDHDARHRGPGPGGPPARRDRGELPPHHRDRRRRRVDRRRRPGHDVREPAHGRDARRDARGHDRRARSFEFMDDETREDIGDGLQRRAAPSDPAPRSATRSSSVTATATSVWTRCSAAPITGRRRCVRGRRLARHRHHRAARRSRSSSATTRRASRRCSRCRPTSWRSSSPTGPGTPARPAPASSATRSAGIPRAASSRSSTPTTSRLAGVALGEVLDGTRGKHEPIRLRLRHIDGHYLWFDCTAENQIDNPTVRGLIIIARDVTDQKVAEDAQVEAEDALPRRVRALTARHRRSITLEGHIIDANAAFSAMAGRTEEELIGVDLEHARPPRRPRAHGRGRRAPGCSASSDTPPAPGPHPAARRPRRVDDERRLAGVRARRDTRVHDRPRRRRHRAQEARGASSSTRRSTTR